MNYYSLALAGFVGMILLIITFLLFARIILNMRVARQYREDLLQKLDRYRLSRMLEALGIDKDDYLHSERSVDIFEHMKRCGECEDTELCDERLASADIDPDNIGFCNNEETLREIARQQKNRDA